jgi:hypothetical protein
MYHCIKESKLAVNSWLAGELNVVVDVINVVGSLGSIESLETLGSLGSFWPCDLRDQQQH